MLDFMSESQNCMIQRTREKVLLQIFWVIEIVQMDPKSKFKKSHDDFELEPTMMSYFIWTS